MDVEQIRKLAAILKETGLTRLEVTEGALVIRLEKQAQKVVSTVPCEAAPQQLPVAEKESLEAYHAEPEPVDFNRMTEIKSPMVGVFYAAASPDAEPFVKRGDRVKRGDVLCIIEAMKLMNEITAEIDGEIADICVDNGQIVEFSQPLFRIC